MYKVVILSDIWALLIPALAVFFIVTKYSWLAGSLSLLAFFLFEMTSVAAGYQSLWDSLAHLIAVLIFSVFLVLLKRFFPHEDIPVSGREASGKDAVSPPSPTEDSTVDLWPPTFSLLTYAEATDLDSKRLYSNIDSSCRYFLELIRRSLDCTTAILLRGNKVDKILDVHSLASSRPDNLSEDMGDQGSELLTPLLQERDEIVVYPVSQQRTNIPYYRSNRGVGGLMAIRVSSEMVSEGKLFILCLDRETPDPWEPWQKDFARMAADKLAMELDIGLHMSRSARNTDTISRICTQMQQMNQVLDLDSTYQVTIQCVRDLVDCDFVALSLIQGGEHKIVRVKGVNAEELIGQKFPITEGLVGQAVKCNHWMPPDATYPGPAPVFSKEKPLSGFKSLFINPICKRGGDIMGVLTVCSRKGGVYRKAEREVLELICRHVATKIELAQAHERIYRQALTDGLTGLKNHRTFQRSFDNRLQRARRQTISLCLILCDLDHFKRINDSYGHPFGDEVLKAVAKTLQETVRAIDLVARYGGEEFAIVLEASDERGGMVQAERVRKAVESLVFRVKGETVKVTMSFGLAVFPQDGEEKQEIVDKTDQTLYLAKKKGRNRVIPYSVFRKNDQD